VSKALWLADLFLSSPDRVVNGVKVYRVFMADARVLVHYYACQGGEDTFFVACVDCRDLEKLVQEHGCRALEWAYSCASSAVLTGSPGKGCPPEVGKKVVSKVFGGWAIKLFDWAAVPNEFIEKYRQDPRAAAEEVFREIEEAADELERRHEREQGRQGQGP